VEAKATGPASAGTGENVASRRTAGAVLIRPAVGPDHANAGAAHPREQLALGGGAVRADLAEAGGDHDHPADAGGDALVDRAERGVARGTIRSARSTPPGTAVTVG